MVYSLTRPAYLRNRDAFNPALSDFFADLFGQAASTAAATEAAAPARFEVVDKADHYEASFDLPGVTKENIDIRIEGKNVAVSAQSRNEEARKDGERVLYSERQTRQWIRSFALPTEVDQERASASYENGVLKLSLPKRDAAQSRKLLVS